MTTLDIDDAFDIKAPSQPTVNFINTAKFTSNKLGPLTGRMKVEPSQPNIPPGKILVAPSSHVIIPSITPPHAATSTDIPKCESDSRKKDSALNKTALNGKRCKYLAWTIGNILISTLAVALAVIIPIIILMNQRDVDECLSSPCVNGGFCTCTTGFTGDHCQLVDQCLEFPCQNGGSCYNGFTNYTCVCAAGYNGNICENVDDYIIVFPENVLEITDPFYLFITAQECLTFRLTNILTSDTETVSLAQGQVKYYEYPNTIGDYDVNVVTTPNTFILNSTGNIDIYIEELSHAYPRTFKIWNPSSEYTHFMSIVVSGETQRHDTLIVAAYDDTQVQIINSTLSEDFTVIIPLKGQSYIYSKTTYPYVIEIISSKPVSVTSSYVCYTLPGTACDGAASQPTPIANWATEYVVPRFDSLSVILTIITASDNNTVTISDGQNSVINKFDLFTLSPISTSVMVNCTSPCQVQAMIYGSTSSGREFDPAMVFLTTRVYQSSYTNYFTTEDPNNVKLATYLVLIVDSTAQSTLLLDSTSLNVTWENIPGSNYKYISIEISESVHQLTYTGWLNGYIVSPENFSGGFARQL